MSDSWNDIFNGQFKRTESGKHALRYKDKLDELEKCIELLAEEASNLLSYGEYIELLKLQLEVQKEIYRMECI